MSIASEITRIKNGVAASYTVCDNKGAILPETQNLDNLADCISGLESGADFTIKREIVNDVYSLPSTAMNLTLPSSVTSLGDRALYYAFPYSSNIVTADLSNITTVNERSLMNTFRDNTNLTSIDLSGLIHADYMYSSHSVCLNCSNLTSVDISSLQTINGQLALYSAFEGTSITQLNFSSLVTATGMQALRYVVRNCANLTSISFPVLTTLGQYGLLDGMNGCTSLTTITFPSLNNIASDCCMQSCFQNCSSLKHIYFPALTTTSFGDYNSQFNSMLNTKVISCTVHFPSNIQSVIQNWSSVTSGFGGKNTIILYDLPATS